MSILKFENRTPKSLEEMYDYMVSDKGNGALIFGIGVNPMNAVAEMKLVQCIYGRYNLMHEYKQIIFSFDVGIGKELPPMAILEVCFRIGQVLVTDNRQILGAIHGIGTDKVHCHYMINYVGIDGALLRQEYTVIYYKNRVNEILTDYSLTPIHYFGERL